VVLKLFFKQVCEKHVGQLAVGQTKRPKTQVRGCIWNRPEHELDRFNHLVDKYIHKAEVLAVLVLLAHAFHELALSLAYCDFLEILLVHFVVVICKFEIYLMRGELRLIFFYFFVGHLNKN